MIDRFIVMGEINGEWEGFWLLAVGCWLVLVVFIIETFCHPEWSATE